MSGPKIAIAVLLFLVGAGVGYLLMQDDRRPDPSGAPEVVGSGSGEVEPGTAPAPEHQGSGVVEPVVPAPIATDAFTGEAPAPDEIGLAILVRDQDQRPVADATLRLLHPWATADDADFALVGYEEWEARTGADGIVRVAELPDSPFRAVARHGDRLGHVNVEPASLSLPARQVIDLRPARRAEVTVVDRAGEAVAHARVMAGSPNFMQPGLSGWTAAPSGVVAFAISPLDPAYEQEKFAPRVRLDTGSFSAEPVPWNAEGVTRARIEVDRGVTLEVKVLGEDGRPHPSPKTLKWKAATTAKPEAQGILVIGLPEAGQGRSREFAGGVVRVAGFKPGATVELTLEEAERCPVRETASLPPVETLYELSLVRGGAAPRLEIPVVDAAGAPVTGERFEVEVSYDRERQNTEHPNQIVFLSAPTMTTTKDLFVSDAGGIITRFVDPFRSGRVQVRPFRPSTAGPYDGIRMGWSMGGPGATSEGEAFPELAPGVTHRLDAVHLPGEEVIAAGTVRDGEGKPVPGAFVQLLQRAFVGEGRPPMLHRVEPEGLRTRCEADGSFVMRAQEGKVVPPDCLLFATHGDQAVSELMPFDRGDTGIEMRLCGTGSIEGTVRCALSGGQPWIRLLPRSGAGVAARNAVNPLIDLATQVAKEGRFALAGLPAGTYDAIVSLFNFEVLKVGGIVIREGEVTRDPRLDGVTVGQEIVEAVVRVRDPSGASIEDASVRLAVGLPAEAGERQMRDTTDAAGQSSIHLLRGSRVDATVDADGYRKWQGKNVTFPLDVVLDPGCRLEVVIDNAAELERGEEKRLFEIEIGAQEDKGGVMVTSAVRSKRFEPAEGKVALRGLDPGSYVASLNVGRALRIEGADFFIHTMTGGGRATELGPFAIREGELTRQLRFRLTPEQLARLREE